MQAFLDLVIKGMVQHPDDVQIVPTERKGETIFEVRVHPSDMGRLVGRRGNTVNAIRTLLSAGAAKQGVRCALELVDERGPSHGHGHAHGHSGHGEGDFRRA
jgi:predicted RNA-binding protein YlqC (UPF0109 family)